MQCSNCAQELTPGALFCGNCGAKLVKNEEQQPEQQPVSAPVETQGSIASAPIEQNPVSPPSAPVAPTPLAQPAEAPQPTPVAAPVAPVAAAVNSAYAVPKKGGSGLSIAALVCGIIALVTCLIWFLSIPLGIAALVMGIIGVRRAGKGMAIAGIVLGTLGILATVAIYALVIGVMSHCADNTTDEACKDINSASAFVFTRLH